MYFTQSMHILNCKEGEIVKVESVKIVSSPVSKQKVHTLLLFLKLWHLVRGRMLPAAVVELAVILITWPVVDVYIMSLN